jgi:hypothetical protein
MMSVSGHPVREVALRTPTRAVAGDRGGELEPVPALALRLIDRRNPHRTQRTQHDVRGELGRLRQFHRTVDDRSVRLATREPQRHDDRADRHGLKPPGGEDVHGQGAGQSDEAGQHHDQGAQLDPPVALPGQLQVFRGVLAAYRGQPHRLALAVGHPPQRAPDELRRTGRSLQRQPGGVDRGPQRVIARRVRVVLAHPRRSGLQLRDRPQPLRDHRAPPRGPQPTQIPRTLDAARRVDHHPHRRVTRSHPRRVRAGVARHVGH